MSEEVSVYELNELDCNNITYTDLSKIKGSGLKTTLNINNQPVCFSLVLNKKSNIDNNTIEFEVDNTNIELLKGIEKSVMNKAYENRETWFSSDFPLEVLEGFYKSFITDNTIKVNISNEDINSVYDTDNNSVNYDDFKENTRLEIVFLIEDVIFLKKEFFCNIQIKQINEMNFFLVNYNSDDEDGMEIDLENSEVVELTDNIIDLDKEKEITEKTRIMEEVKEELELLKKSVVEKELILSNTEEELSKLNYSC